MRIHEYANKNKKLLLVLIVVTILILSIAIRYWPVFHKGFSYTIEADNLILARNLSQAGEYKIDNEKNVVLSSEIVKEAGIESKIGNKLTPVLYSKVFDIFGFGQEIPLWTSLILYGVVSVLLFLLVLKLFNLWVALIFIFIDIFSPLVLQYATRSGAYEWAMLFLTIALLIYLWKKEKPGLFKLFLAGLFFALASLARNSFLIIPFAFLVYDFIKTKSFKRVIIFILPVLIFWGVYLGPDFIEKGVIDSAYMSSQETTGAYMHIFPDPYTWHFERDSYVKEVLESGNYNYDYSQFLSKYGYEVGLKNKILMYWASITSYPQGLFAQTTIGGPILVFLLILGVPYLHRRNKELLKLFIIWAGLTYLFLIAMASNQWGHFLSLQLPIFLLISLGIYWIGQFVLKQDFKSIFKYLLIFGFIFALFLHLIQSDKWTFHESYLYTNTEETLALVDSIEEEEMDKRTDVIAVGLKNPASSVLNWYTDYSFVYFAPDTVEKLLKEEKLQWAFDQVGVTKIIGYDDNLTKRVIEFTTAKNI